jgi:GH25 family lysozyme M1 (1,4-beta-N-acetylmuramidase)
MKPNTCLLIDTWEGQGEIDEAVLKANGVAGIGIRINNITGGHHMDSGFVKQWAEAAGFVRFPHFVYNPWVGAQDNYDWLAANMPSDALSVAIDIFVQNTALSPAKYASDVATFLNLCSGQGWKTIIYTGGWCLPFLSEWPKADYWWAQYPYASVYASSVKDWDTLKTALDALDKPFNANLIPGALVMWQFTGNMLVMPGNPNKMDINIFYGTPANLADYFLSNPANQAAFPRLMRIKDDIEAGSVSRPFLRNGLPSTVRISGGKGFVRLTNTWLAFVAKLNTSAAYNYLFKDSSGWHNNGDANRVEQLTFSGNIVRVNNISSGKAYIETLFLNDNPPAPVVIPSISNLSTTIHYFTTQYNTYLDMSADGRWPRILVIANPGETLYMDVNDLADYQTVLKKVRVTVATLNVRTAPSVNAKKAGTKIFGNTVMVYGLSTVGFDIWGRIDVNLWMGLKVGGKYFTDWQV